MSPHGHRCSVPMSAPQALPPTPSSAELRGVLDFCSIGAIGKSMRRMGQMGQNPLLGTLLGGLEPRAQPSSQRPSWSAPWHLLPQVRNWPAAPQRPMGPTEPPAPPSCPGSSALCGRPVPSSQLCILARAHALIRKEGLALMALNPPLRSSDSSRAALAALHTCLQGRQFPG